MDYRRFYRQLLRPVERRIGKLDPETLTSVVGFTAGGPISLNTIGHGRGRVVTYVSCELAVRKDQRAGEGGPYELMMTCDNENWARSVITGMGTMSLKSRFAHGHTVDISRVVPSRCRLKGLVVEEFARVRIRKRSYRILRLLGVTRPELAFAMRFGADKLLDRLRKAHVYPRTSLRRRVSVV